MMRTPQYRCVHDDVTAMQADEDPWSRLDLGPLPEPVVVAPGVQGRFGAVYSSPVGYRPLELDIFAPAGGAGPRPAVVWVHGGAFQLGSRRLLPDFLSAASFFTRLATHGFVVASIDYRLSGEAGWPAQIEDVRSAVRWLRARASILGIDPSAIAVWGESAGAHLAAMAGVLTGDGSGADVAVVVDWYGPTEFSRMDAQAPADSAMCHDDPDSPESRLIGAPVQSAPERVAAASPLSYVGPNLPPFLIRHGTSDRVVPFGQSEIFASALRGAGASVDFAAVPGAGHVFEGHADPSVYIDEAIRFLTSHLPVHDPQHTSEARA